MCVTRLGLLALLSWGMLAAGHGAIALPMQAATLRPAVMPVAQVPLNSIQVAPIQVAQTSDSGCRQTNTTTGVYEQPNLDSTSRGILTSAQTVRLEVMGTGTGWARISQPIVGWIEARYLTPIVPCEGLSATVPPAMTPEPTTRPNAMPVANRSSNPQSTSQQPARESFPEPDLRQLRPNRPGDIAQITAVTCEVLPAYGLIVRSEPVMVDATYLATILPGTYRFQFTRNTKTNPTSEGIQRWVYITAPLEGWISLGYVGKEFNLGGRECG
ncbi:MAG: hypothetical protein HC772_13310 [Leptolyngbyaceae cyanobacterium CRU_2_3]|nr:hypothetical protein [Leptolyngbyaceae cyanobacterium CRU_2_3]